MSDIEEVVKVWSEYIESMPDWQVLVVDVEPKNTECGPVYEPESPLSGRTETFAIADMRNINVAQPHYHANNETEICFVIQGSGLTVMGGEEIEVEKGSIVVTPPNTAHYTFPQKDLVMVVINTPSFKLENNIGITDTNPDVKFSKEQYELLLSQNGISNNE